MKKIISWVLKMLSVRVYIDLGKLHIVISLGGTTLVDWEVDMNSLSSSRSVEVSK